jgi:phage protein D
MTIQRSEPVFYVTIERGGRGAERPDLDGRVLSLEYEDDDRKADKLVVELDNSDLSLLDSAAWREGNIIRASWGYPDRMSPERRLVIKSVKGLQTLKVEAHALSVVMNNDVKSKTWPVLEPSEIVRRIGTSWGFGPSDLHIQPTHGLAGVFRTQAKWTDAQFIQWMAGGCGYQFFVDFDGLHFHRRGFGKRPVRELVFYTDSVGEITSVDVESDLSHRPGSVTLKGRDPVTKKDISAKATEGATDRETTGGKILVVDGDSGAIRRRVSIGPTSGVGNSADGALVAQASTRPTAHQSSAGAKAEADAMYRRGVEGSIKLSIKMIGDPQVLAKSVVKVSGIGKRLSGRYYVVQAKHRIDGSGYNIELKCQRDAHDSPDGQTAKGKTEAEAPKAATGGELKPVIQVDGDSGRRRTIYRDTPRD